MPYSELLRDKKGKVTSVEEIAADDLHPPASTRLVLTKDLNQWELVQPPMPRGEQMILIASFTGGMGLFAFLQLFLISTDGSGFFGLILVANSLYFIFVWRWAVTQTTATIENGELVIARSLYDGKPYCTKRWDVSRAEIERIESVYVRGAKHSRTYVRIHGKHKTDWNWLYCERGYAVFQENTFSSRHEHQSKKAERDWIAREMAQRLDVPVVTQEVSPYWYMSLSSAEP